VADLKKGDLQRRVTELEKKVETLKGELAEKERLLTSMYTSKTWKLGQLYGRLFGMESFWREKISSFAKKIFGIRPRNKWNTIISSPVRATDRHYQTLLEFISHITLGKGIFVMIARPKIVEGIGFRAEELNYRVVGLANEFSKEGVRILYVFTEQKEGVSLDHIERVSENILQMSIQLFFKTFEFFFERINSFSTNKVLFIHRLHPCVVEIVCCANAYNWTTVYDILDNWEEFSKAGWLTEWYSRDLEEFVVSNADIKIAVSYFLQRKFNYSGNVHIVHNGYYPDSLNVPVKNLKQGEVTAGYFGSLEKYRFDWDLLLSIAERHKDWLFYLIGRMPRNIRLRENIISLGTLHPAELYAYAQNWDVALLPFKVNNLTISCDSLKVYEYLSFRLPVVARGVGEHVRNYPYVYIAETERDFEKYITIAASTRIEEDKITDFLRTSDWSSRAKEILTIVQSGKPNYKEYIFESPLHT